MKSKRIHLILTLIGLILTTQCGQPDVIEPDKIDKVREFTTATKNEGIANFKNFMKTASSSGRVQSSIYDRVNWNKVYRVFNSETQLTTYTMPLRVTTPNQFDNLIVVENSEEQHAYIIRYKADPEWIKNKPRRGGFDTFTGTLQIVNTSGEVEASTDYKNGQPIPNSDSTNTNGRVAACETWIDVAWTEVCVEGNCTVTEIEVTEYEICDDGGGGGGTTGGGSTGGGSTGGTGPDGGGEPIGGGGGGSPTPIGGGDPGAVDPVDVSYYLTPVLEGDDMSNPYHGMKAVDDNGVIYTYDATINAWLLPDLVILAENYEMNFDNGQLINDFDGSILSTMVVVALAEPTPIGEIIVGGVILGIFIYEAYQIATTNLDDATRDHCVTLFEQCTGIYAYKNMPCATCEQFCITQGYWDFNNCPLSH